MAHQRILLYNSPCFTVHKRILLSNIPCFRKDQRILISALPYMMENHCIWLSTFSWCITKLLWTDCHLNASLSLVEQIVLTGWCIMQICWANRRLALCITDVEQIATKHVAFSTFCWSNYWCDVARWFYGFSYWVQGWPLAYCLLSCGKNSCAIESHSHDALTGILTLHYVWKISRDIICVHGTPCSMLLMWKKKLLVTTAIVQSESFIRSDLSQSIVLSPSPPPFFVICIWRSHCVFTWSMQVV